MSVHTVVVLPACFLLGRSSPVYRLFLLFSSINCFSSGQVRSGPSTQYCSCSYSRQFHFSPSIVYALLLTRPASVRRLFLLFSSINSVSSRQFCSSPSIVSAVLVASSVDCLCSSSRLFYLVRRLFMLFSSINRFSSHQFCSSPSITSVLLIDGFGRG